MWLIPSKRISSVSRGLSGAVLDGRSAQHSCRRMKVTARGTLHHCAALFSTSLIIQNVAPQTVGYEGKDVVSQRSQDVSPEWQLCKLCCSTGSEFYWTITHTLNLKMHGLTRWGTIRETDTRWDMAADSELRFLNSRVHAAHLLIENPNSSEHEKILCSVSHAGSQASWRHGTLL